MAGLKIAFRRLGPLESFTREEWRTHTVTWVDRNDMVVFAPTLEMLDAKDMLGNPAFKSTSKSVWGVWVAHNFNREEQQKVGDFYVPKALKSASFTGPHAKLIAEAWAIAGFCNEPFDG